MSRHSLHDHDRDISLTSPSSSLYRREELNIYWQQVILIDQVTDFKKHHCSQEIKAFLDVDLIVKPSEVIIHYIASHRMAAKPFGLQEK
jgi:hypothetical protein